jgi:putative oxidoreductase
VLASQAVFVDPRGMALDSCRDLGLLVLRVGVGLSFVGYGAPKLFGGPRAWQDLGQAMTYLGISFAPSAWGFLAAVSEFFGGMALVAGGLLRPAAFFLVCTMTVATVQHFGRYSLDERARAASRKSRDRR